MKKTGNKGKSNKEKENNKLFAEKQHGWSQVSEKEELMKFSENYKKFLGESKTEKKCVENITARLKEQGFKDIQEVSSLKQGDKFFKNVKGKTLIAGIVGEEKDKFRLIGSHIDAPRLDLKPNPLYEDSNLGLLQSHYYGGIKKYHRVNTPLSLIGVVYTQEGSKVEVQIGEGEDDPKFIIPDLLPHLAKNQVEKKASEVISGEELNIVFGHLTLEDEEIKEKVKLNILDKLYKEYGMTEEDFSFAEFEFLPSGKPFDVGIDRGMIGGYAHDDRVCVYTSLQALLEVSNPKKTCIGFFVDREEIGSVGDTGAESFVLLNFVKDYIRLAGMKKQPYEIFEKSLSVSGDVTAGLDPTYKDKVDPANAYHMGSGIALEKYIGALGKKMTNEAHCDYMNYLREICSKNGVSWQTGETGKIDEGGGGTIAMFISRYGIDCVDIGIPVLGMHSPCEVASKIDVHSLYKFYKSFFEDKADPAWQ